MEGVGLRLGEVARDQLGGHVRRIGLTHHLPRRRDHCQVLGMVAVEVVAAETLDRRADLCVHQRVPEVAAEHLVGTLAGQHDLDLFRHPLAEQIERDHVVAHHRFRHQSHRFGQAGQHLAVGDEVLLVTGFESRGDQVRELEFVGFLRAHTDAGNAIEADREGQQVVDMIGQQTDRQVRIQPTRQQHTHRHVGGRAVAVERAHQHLARLAQPLGFGQRLRRPRGVQRLVHAL